MVSGFMVFWRDEPRHREERFMVSEIAVIWRGGGMGY
jgi:hypothetical protein